METRTSLSPSAIARIASRLMLGAIFLVFGLNGFFHFLPQPPMEPGPAASFVGGLAASGYLFPMMKGIEVIAGVLLIANLFVPLTLAVLAPIVVNIFAFHLFLAPGGMAIAVVVLALELAVAWHHRAAFSPMLRARTAAANVDRASVSAGRPIGATT